MHRKPYGQAQSAKSEPFRSTESPSTLLSAYPFPVGKISIRLRRLLVTRPRLVEDYL